MRFCYTTIKTELFLPAFFVLFFSFYVQAQTSTSSPYSRFGPGRLENTGYASNMAMGGCYTAYQNDTLIYLLIKAILLHTPLTELPLLKLEVEPAVLILLALPMVA